MCGLAGFLNFDRRFDSGRAQQIVREMAEAMHYRGPDMEGYWASEDNRCHLGHKRLSIIDLSEAGRQPMLDDSGRYVIVFNGEIYNFQELRDKLAAAGVSFRTKTDTEVLLKGYIQFGAALFPQLDGMFAVAIYDTVKRTLTLARDRAGEKPLYYRNVPGLFLFGSELHALTKVPDLDWDISPAALALYMLYRYVPAPQSILEGVRKLKPGCLLTIDSKGKTFERRYYAFEVDPEAEGAKEHFLETCDLTRIAIV
ncbi:MAG: asparagine synthetase B family protein [Dongiaceae bacterium]